MDKRTEENLRVKRSIVNALFLLLKDTGLEDISISKITRVAKVSRMAYYRNFKSKIEIIDFFLEDVLNDMLALLEEDFDFWTPEYGRAYFQTMKKHKDRVLKLYEIGLSALFLNRFNATNEEIAGDMPRDSIERYRLYYAAGAAYNGVVEWLKGGCQESVDEIEKSLRTFINFDNQR